MSSFAPGSRPAPPVPIPCRVPGEHGSPRRSTTPRPGIRIVHVLLAVFILGASSGCDTNEPVTEADATPVMDDGEFIEIIADLRAVARTAESSEAFETERDSILEARGTSDDDLVRYAETRGGEITAMIAVLDSIDSVLSREDEESQDSDPETEG